MAINIPLESMTVAEKLEALESIWTHLCQTPAQVPSPEWHAEVLAERRQRLEAGSATLTSWQEAKKGLQELGA
ncbi:MAG: addiction module protein [Cyanothece sp. SIO2G6]|nr:addiction module protein [Cyanothece sp. SIO2G6]